MGWLTLAHYLDEALPGRVVTPGLSQSELREQALALSAALRTQGVRQLAAYLDDAAELALVLLAAWHAGIPVVLPPDLQARSRTDWLAACDVFFTDQPESSGVAWRGWLARQAGVSGTASCRPLSLDQTAIVVRTSGSSGQPKSIAKTLRQLQDEIAVLEQQWGDRMGPHAVVLGSVSTQHIYGLTFRLLWPLMAGRPLARQQQVFAEDLQRATQAHAGCVWIGSPALYRRMADNLDWADLAGRVRHLFSAGGVLPGAVAERLHRRLGQWPVEIYGSSETGAIASRQGLGCWRGLPGVEIGSNATMDDALWVRSPWLRPGQTEQTADAVALCADGGFELHDRLDRIVKLEDKRIALARIEQPLSGHAWVDELRSGVFHAGRAQVGCVVVPSAEGLHVLRNRGRHVLTQTLLDAVKEHVDPLAWPRRWRLTEALEWTAQGKLAQSRVDAQLQGPRPRQPVLEQSEQHADGSWTLRFSTPLDLVFFSGHFSQVPVVPGVAQIEWARAWAQDLWQQPIETCEFEALKFQRLMRPGDKIELTLSQARGKLYFAYVQAGGEACSSGRMVLMPVDRSVQEIAHA